MKCEDCKLEHCYRLTDIPFDKDPCSTCKVQETGETYGFKDICKKCNKDNCYFDPREEEKIELKPCPLCGREVSVSGGEEEWRPTFGDPDSGGDPYHIRCNCGLDFCVGCVEYDEFVERWNRRADK